ncbi:alpha/beta hydrolase [Arcanobacterium hippocoleae]|uniref:alpha/beta hydrolase n=1 Tax=Arcanobacterium hippocoleae TaxID=149017 RepID=UPI00333EBD24
MIVFLALQINVTGGYVKNWREIPALLGWSGNQEISLTDVKLPSEQERIPIPKSEIDPGYRTSFREITDPKLRGAGFRGTYLETNFHGLESDISQPVRIWLPENWEQAKELKVIIFLHGFPSNPHLAQANLGIGRQLGKLVAAEKISPTMIVFPEIRPDEKEPDCLDIAGRPAIATFIVRDVVQMVKANFPVSQQREDWAITGNSAGAYCAGLLAGVYPANFGSAIILSGYDQPLLGALKYLPPKDRQEYRISEIFRNSDLPVRIYNYWAGNDRDAKELAARISAVNNPQLAMTNVYDADGSHNWRAWSRAFPDAVKWFAPGKYAQEKILRKSELMIVQERRQIYLRISRSILLQSDISY